MSEIDHTYWYLSRSAGIVAYLLLFASVVLGLTMTGGLLEKLLPRHRRYDLHRYVTLLALAMTVFHALIVLPDDYVAFSVAELLVPFASPYRPLYMGLGALALYLSAIVVLTFYLRAWVPYHAWRLLHYATFGVFALALVHGIGAGTDTEAGWAQYLYAATGLTAFNLLVYRALKGGARAGREPAAVRSQAAPVEASRLATRSISRNSIETQK